MIERLHSPPKVFHCNQTMTDIVQNTKYQPYSYFGVKILLVYNHASQGVVLLHSDPRKHELGSDDGTYELKIPCAIMIFTDILTTITRL